MWQALEQQCCDGRERLEGMVSLAVGRMEGESRSQMVQRTTQGSKGPEQSWLQL